MLAWWAGMHADTLLLEDLPFSRRRLRVSMVTETYPPEINGVAMTIGRLVGGLQGRDHQVQLVRPRQGREATPPGDANLEQILRPGIPIPRYSGLSMGLPAKRLLFKLWSLHPPDVVHIATEGPLGWSALAAARKLRIPIVSGFHTNFHSYTAHYGLGWLKKPVHAYLRKFHNQTSVTLVPTRRLRDELAGSGYRNVQVLARGVDSRLFSPDWRSEALRRDCGLTGQGLAVAYVGRIAPEKNLPLLIRAFEAIERIRPDARLILVGDGPDLARLQASHPRFVFRGPRQGEDLAAHYASADIFLFPSTTETFGNSLTEAMASGLATVSFDYAAASEHVIEGENGLKATFMDEAAFIRQARRLAEQPEEIAHLGGNARKTALGMSWDDIHDRLESLYLDVIRKREAVQQPTLRALGLN